MEWVDPLASDVLLVGQAFDPPWNWSAPFFEEDNGVQGSFIMPGSDLIWEYYWVAGNYSVKGLFWYWYPSSYASALDDSPYVHNVWTDQEQIWEDLE